MTRVDFYILEDMDLDAMQRFACRLATKAVATGNVVHIHTSDSATASTMDDLLWEYPEQRFIPHGIVTAGDPDASAGPNTAVTLGWTPPADVDGVLINLSPEIPGFFGRFDRVAEIVLRSARDAGRERYRFYRDRGYPLFNHKLDDWEAQ